MENLQQELFGLVQFGYDNKNYLLRKLLNIPNDMADATDIDFLALSGSKTIIKITNLPNIIERDYFVPTSKYLSWVDNCKEDNYETN